MLRQSLARIALLTLIVGPTFGCTASLSRLNQSAEKLVREAIVQSELNRCTEHPSPCLTDTQFKAVNRQLNIIAVSGQEFTKLEIAGSATIKDAATFLQTVYVETSALAKAYPEGALKTVLDKLLDLESTVRDIIRRLNDAGVQA